MSARKVKAIETVYKGYRFRSRLEARWAVFFDSLGIQWEYEPEGFELPNGTRYLPDFKLFGRTWFEVKGAYPSQDEIEKAQLLAEGTDAWVCIAHGTVGVPKCDRGGLIDGSRIIGLSPSRDINNLTLFTSGGNDFSATDLAYGFYEDDDGDIQIDNLYLSDLPIVAELEPRTALAVGFNGFTVPRFNLGRGRLYRSPRRVCAYTAARQARFEHGERGAL